VNLVFIGFMGVGKTCVGQEVAKRLGWSFIDTDTLIENAYAMPIWRIFVSHGEASFRGAERRIVERAAKHRRCVIATGGGVVLDRGNVDCLKRHGLLIHLTLSPEDIFDRIGDQNGRPLLEGGNRWQTLKRLLRSREQLYRACADLTIDRNGLGVNETVEKVLTMAASYGVEAQQLDKKRERR
jgi:shikimate kinase